MPRQASTSVAGAWVLITWLLTSAWVPESSDPTAATIRNRPLASADQPIRSTRSIAAPLVVARDCAAAAAADERAAPGGRPRSRSGVEGLDVDVVGALHEELLAGRDVRAHQ